MARERSDTPERWAVSAGSADVATLDIPADARRDRRFEIDCRFVVRAREAATAPWHELRVYVDGDLEWSRRIPTANAGSTDSLDYHFRRDLSAGRPLRVVARTAVHGAARVMLRVEAEEG